MLGESDCYWFHALSAVLEQMFGEVLYIRNVLLIYCQDAQPIWKLGKTWKKSYFFQPGENTKVLLAQEKKWPVCYRFILKYDVHTTMFSAIASKIVWNWK